MGSTIFSICTKYIGLAFDNNGDWDRKRPPGDFHPAQAIGRGWVSLAKMLGVYRAGIGSRRVTYLIPILPPALRIHIWQLQISYHTSIDIHVCVRWIYEAKECTRFCGLISRVIDERTWAYPLDAKMKKKTLHSDWEQYIFLSPTSWTN